MTERRLNRLDGRLLRLQGPTRPWAISISARTDPEAKGSRGVSIFAVERDAPGFSVGRALDKHGWRSSDTAELVFEDCRLPADAMIGEENRGFHAIMRNFQNERIVIGAMAVGESTKAIEMTLEHVKQREAFGGSLWDKQAIRQRLAMLQAEVDAARQLVYHAAWLDARGEDATREVSMVKALCGELDCPLLISGTFVAAAGTDTGFRSLGRHTLRGIREPQELFTADTVTSGPVVRSMRY